MSTHEPGRRGSKAEIHPDDDAPLAGLPPDLEGRVDWMCGKLGRLDAENERRHDDMRALRLAVGEAPTATRSGTGLVGAIAALRHADERHAKRIAELNTAVQAVAQSGEHIATEVHGGFEALKPLLADLARQTVGLPALSADVAGLKVAVGEAPSPAKPDGSGIAGTVAALWADFKSRKKLAAVSVLAGAGGGTALVELVKLIVEAVK